MTMIALLALFLFVAQAEAWANVHPSTSATRSLALRSTVQMGLFDRGAKKSLKDSYDYIIVGGGTAGCVLANRLSEDPAKKVLLLEAGSPKYKSKYMRIPAGIVRLFKTKFDWNFESEKEPGVQNRNIYLCRGKVLGGSSSLNVLLYHRGTADDYKHWAKATGDHEWSPEAVLPYFKKSQDHYKGESKYHGIMGEFSVDQVRYQNPLSKTFLSACEELSFPANTDFNDWSHSQEGAGRFDVSEKNGERCSTATGFLAPAKNRKNLKVVTGAMVHKINVNNAQAEGVKVEVKGEVFDVPVGHKGEVLLCGGAINSPQLLMLSGIGDEAELKAHQIPCVQPLPHVGKHLQDHPAAVVSYSTPVQGISVTSKLRLKGTKLMNPKVFLQWLLFKTGLLTSTGCDHGGFFRTQSELTNPDLQMRFLAARALSPDGMSTYSKFRESPNVPDGFSFQSIVSRPRSEGKVGLKSSNPSDSPAIYTGYFTDPADLHTMREGLRLSRKIASAGAFKEYVGEEVYPGATVQSDHDLDAYIKSTVHTSNALVGTCRMGKSHEDSVVDGKLRVHGVGKLRVIDASVMPKIIGGQTSAPTVMIAEKAAVFLKTGN